MNGENIIEIKIEPVNKISEELNSFLARLRIHNIQMINIFKNIRDGTECEVKLSLEKTSTILVCPIPGDGNCLLGSIVHQHFHLEVGSDKYIQKVTELRHKVVAHIKANLKQFERQLSGRIYDKRSQTIEKRVKIRNFEEESTNFLDNYLSKDHHWAGEETTQAVSELFKANIIIFDEWSDVRFGNSFDPSYQDIITVAFRVQKKHNRQENAHNIDRNHFDSIIRLNDDILQESAAILMEKYNKGRTIKNVSSAIYIG